MGGWILCIPALTRASPHLVASQPEIIIPSWQIEKLMLREDADLPKVTYPELEANLEPGDLGFYWLLFSLQSGHTHSGCFRLREPLHHCQAGAEAADRGAPVLCLCLSSSNLEIAILLATAHSCAKLYSLQLARELRVQYLICSLWSYWELKIIIPTLQLKRLRLKNTTVMHLSNSLEVQRHTTNMYPLNSDALLLCWA